MTRRVRLGLRGGTALGDGGTGTVRLLAVSDEHDRTLDSLANRERLGPIDLVIGCGDLDPEWLAFMADAFRSEFLFVRGNHDRGRRWDRSRPLLPTESASGRPVRRAGLELLPLGWPAGDAVPNRPNHAATWRHAVGGWARVAGRPRPGPLVVVSHVPPLGFGDAEDPYHRGFAAYRWLLHRVRPVLWLHGHTPMITVPWIHAWEGTTLLNVTGSVLVELVAGP